MPRSPILPVIDWKSVIESGKPFEKWVAEGEAPDNRERISARLQTLSIPPEIQTRLDSITLPVHIVAIAEPWCGDVVRHVPALQRMVESTQNLSVRYITREQYPEIFIRFLTNGGEAVPKFVFLSDRYVECGNWGPMPAACREVIARGKACADVGQARRIVSAMYADDPELYVVMSELTDLAEIASTASL